MFSTSDDESDKDCETSETRAPPKKVKRLCQFDNESIKSFFVSQEDGNPQSKIAAAELAWVYHANQHSLSYQSLDCSVKLSKATFADSEVVTKMSCGQTKGETLMTDVLAPHSVELILSDLANDYAFYSISSSALNHGNQTIFPLCLRYLDLNNGISNRLLDFYEDSNETAENVKQKIVDILSAYKLDLSYLSAYSDSTNVNSDKYHSVFQLLTKDNENIVAAKCPAHLVYNCAKKGCDLLTYDIEAFIMKVFGHFSVSSQRAEGLNEIFDFLEMEGNSLLSHFVGLCPSLLPAIEKVLKCWPAIKSYFQSLGEEDCPSLIWKYIEDETEEKNCSKTEIYMLFLQHVLRVFEETIRILEKDELTAPELFGVMFRLRQKLLRRKDDSFFGHRTGLEICKMSPQKASQVKQDFVSFFTKTIDYLESNFDFSNSNHLCALTPFSLKTRRVNYEEIQRASECLKMMDALDMDSLYDEYTDAKCMMDKQVACKDKPVDKKWVDIFAEMKTNSYKFKNLLLLVSKILSIPCSNAFVERIFSFMSSRSTDTKNRCYVGLMRAELQVKVNFRFDCLQFYQYIKEKKDVLKAAERSERYDWKRK